MLNTVQIHNYLRVLFSLSEQWSVLIELYHFHVFVGVLIDRSVVLVRENSLLLFYVYVTYKWNQYFN